MDVRDARRRRIRTTVQTVVAAAPVMLVIVPLLLEHLEGSVPGGAYSVLASAGALIVALASWVTRVMAHPTVAAFIARHLPWLAAEVEPTDAPRP